MTSSSSTSSDTQKPDLKKQQRISPTQSKKNYQHIWKSVFLLISTISLILVHKIYLYQTSENLSLIRKGSIFQLIVYGIPFCVLFILGQNFSHYLLDEKCQKYFICHQKFVQEQKRKKRCFLIIKWGYNVIYYVFSNIAGYLIIKNTSIMPTWLGGDGTCTEVGRYVNSLDQATVSMKILYVIHFGRHLAKLIQHCFLTPEGNYFEFTLHHSLSVFLIFFSYLMNMWLMGLFVLLIHDASDIFLIVARVSRDGKSINKIFLMIVDALGGFLWISCRIFLLSYCCIYSGINTLLQFWYQPKKFNQQIIDLVYFPIAFMTLMLFALEIVQMFWTYYIICAFVGSRISDKIAKHSYD